MLAAIWRLWIKVAGVIGTVQMVVALSLVYWLLLMPMAVVLKLASDNLALKRPSRPRWRLRDSAPDMLDSMKNQF